MRAVVQRVKESKVEVKGRNIGAIGPGLLVFLGVGEDDSERDCDYLANKIAHLRIFPDEMDLMNLSLMDTGKSLLCLNLPSGETAEKGEGLLLPKQPGRNEQKSFMSILSGF